MIYNSFKYSLKLWLTSVFIAPLLFLVLVLFQKGVHDSEFLKSIPESVFMYVMLLGFEVKSSALLWALFTGIIIINLVFSFKTKLKEWLIVLAAILLCIGASMVKVSPIGFFGKTDDFSLMLCNCACIVWGVWLYKLKR
jgi:predicted membrane-bound mannosyltransferase